MKIAILYICTGKYKIFWDNFYKSCEDNFLTFHTKHYFVFTDATDLNYGNNVTIISESSKGFPLDSLLRFKMFSSIESHLKNFDYLFFFNSNMLIVDHISEEILPNNEENGLVALHHPGYYTVKSKYLPYERNSNSNAFIKYNKYNNYLYYMGSLNGGRSIDFLNLINLLKNNIHDDLNKNIIAIYHDESHLNSYLNQKKIKVLDPSYGFPEDSNLPFKPRIIILDKIKHGGGYFDKLPKKNIFARITIKLRSLKNAIIWKYI